jgi:hypothetical protein
MSASQQARNKVLAITLDNERHEFARREMALCQEIERLRKAICIAWREDLNLSDLSVDPVECTDNDIIERLVELTNEYE